MTPLRTRGEKVHCLSSCAYSTGAVGMAMLLGCRDEAVGERCTVCRFSGGGV